MSEQTTWNVGDRPRVKLSFRTDAEENPTPADPTDVVVRALKPSGGNAVLVDAVKDEVGEYHAEVSLTEAGVWTIRGEGTGAVEAAVEVKIIAKPTKFPALP